MKTVSKTGIDLIKRFEGLRLSAYRDAVGVPTIGYGHTRTAKLGRKISEAEAESLLREDLDRFEKAVNAMVQVELGQHEFDALVSFAFNVGADALRKSTLLKLLHGGQRQAAADQLLRWDHAGGRQLAGLTDRRHAERDLFLRPVAPAQPGDSAQPWDPDGIEIDLPTLRDPFPKSAAAEVLRRLLPPSPSLEGAVKRFQSEEKLTIDGIVGPVTWRALLSGNRPA